MFKTTKTSVTKLINSTLTSNKPLKKEYKEFEKKSQMLDLSALRDIGVMFKVDKVLNNKEVNGFLNNQAVSIVLAMSSKHPYGKIAFTAYKALSIASDVMMTEEQKKESDEILEVTKALNDFEKWPSIYDYEKLQKAEKINVTPALNQLLLGIPQLLIEMSREALYEVDNSLASNFLYYTEVGHPESKIKNLIDNIEDKDALDVYQETQELINTYNRVEELRHDLEVIKEHIDKYPTPINKQELDNLRLYKVIYDMLYRESLTDELYALYIKAYSELTGDSSRVDDYPFYKVALKNEYKEFVPIAPITSYDIHLLINKGQREDSLYRTMQSAVPNIDSIQGMSTTNKGKVLDEYEKLKDNPPEEEVSNRFFLEIKKLRNRIIAGMGKVT